MIFWIDEDESYNYPSELLLRKSGYTVQSVRNATDALPLILSEIDRNMDFAIVDVMLARGSDHGIFSDFATENGLTTGLVLVRELVRRHPSADWRRKLVIHSRASRNEIVAKIEVAARETGVYYLPKKDDFKARNFVTWLREMDFIKT